MSSHTLVIVDDDKDIRELLTDVLKQYGYHALSAGSGKQLYTLLDEHKIDLIILDIRMPGEDGFVICKNNTFCSVFKQVIVILLISGHISILPL